MLKKVWSYPVDFCIRFRTYVTILYTQLKKKAFKINAKIEDVGLNED